MKKELKNIVGKENVFDDQATLERYSRDQSFVRACRPDFVVLPKDTEEVQEVVKFANSRLVPIVPFSSGLNLHGGTIPHQGGIILNLSRMDRIIEINEYNRFAWIEPGVTYARLQDELEKHDLRVMVPFGVPPERSVLSSKLERFPVLASAATEYGNDLCMDMEAVLPDGNIFRTAMLAAAGGKSPGGAGASGPHLWWNRIFEASQGTFGIVTQLVIKVEVMPKYRRIFFLTFNDIEEATTSLREIQKKELGMECFLLNRFNLACMLTEDWILPTTFPSEKKPSEHFEGLKKNLPPWTLMICLSGLRKLPREKVEYESEDLKDVCEAMGVELKPNGGGIQGLEKVMLEELLRPWSILKKFRYRGSCHDLSFHCPLHLISEIEKAIKSLADKHSYPLSAIGGYALPVERGRALYCEYDFHCDLNDPQEKERVRSLWFEASEEALRKGGVFDRLYAPWSEMVYRRAGLYPIYLKKLKKEFDPNNIMNPGKLCF